MFHIRSARRTVDSKIDENRCKQKYELIQVMGVLYSYQKLQYYTDHYLPVSMEKIQCGFILLFCIFETSVLATCGVNRDFFFTLSHMY